MYQSFFVVRICSQRPRTWEHIIRPCIWTHGTLTPVWFSHRRTSWLRRLTALLPLQRSTCLLCVSIIMFSACRGLRYECCRNVRVLKAHRCAFALVARSSRNSRRKVNEVLIFSCQGSVGDLQKKPPHFLCRFSEGVERKNF